MYAHYRIPLMTRLWAYPDLVARTAPLAEVGGRIASGAADSRSRAP
jgi:hypothetical protein